jgi:hypothetical protein
VRRPAPLVDWRPWTLRRARAFLAKLEREIEREWHVGLLGSVLLRGRSEKDLDACVYPHTTARADPQTVHLAMGPRQRLLQALAAGDAYGIELARLAQMDVRQVYTYLHRLEREGLVASRLEPTPPGEQGPARRVYSRTS